MGFYEEMHHNQQYVSYTYSVDVRSRAMELGFHEPK